MAKIKEKPARPSSSAQSSSAAGSAAGAQNRRLILIAAISIIVIVEALIFFGLRDRYVIASYRNRAKAAYAAKNYDKAMVYYQKLLKIAPVSVPVNSETGDTYIGLGQYETAIRHFNTALSTNPAAKGINAKIGLSFIELAQPDKALVHFEKELALDGENADALFYIGRQEFETGRYLEAGAKMQALANHPQYGEKVHEITRQMREKAESAVTSAEATNPAPQP